jgi:hypothetical protein
MEIVENAKAQFTFHLNGKRIIVSVFSTPDDSDDDDEHESVEDYLIKLMTGATDDELELYEDEDHQFYERSVDKATETIMDVG